MLNKITFNSKFTNDSDFIDLLDCLLLYDEVVLLTNSINIKLILNKLGIDLINELHNLGRLNLLFHDNVFGPGIVNKEDIYISTYTSKNTTLEGILYEYNRRFVNNSTINNSFASQHTKLFNKYSYPLELTDSVYFDLQNEKIINNYFQIYIRSKAESLIKHNISLEFKSNGKEFLNRELYNVDFAGDFKSFEDEYKNILGHEFSITDFLLQFGLTRGDFILSSDLNSEISNPINLGLFKAMSFDIFNKNIISKNHIESFEEYVLNNYTSVGKAFINQKISGDTLIKIYNSTEEFRKHIKNLSDYKNIVGEYNKQLDLDFKTSNKHDTTIKFIIGKVISKIAEYAVKSIVPPYLIDTANTIKSVCLDTFDLHFYDKIKKGWQPKGKLTEFENLKSKHLS
ncbi:MAG: hypothetical protein ACI35Z_16080 [Sphingobacterium hotanense]